MKIGTQIIAPEGWKSMPKDVRFYFLCNSAKTHRVLLAYFQGGEAKQQASADILVVHRAVFEDGCRAEMIVPVETQNTLPPWLKEFEGFDLTQIDRYRPSSSKTPHQQRVEARYFHIQQALAELTLILASRNPKQEIHRYARQCNPKQNESRFRLWFLTYLCFGQNLWSLLPPFHHSGIWDRKQFPEKKFGAPNLAYGKNYGNGMTVELVELCIKSYLKRAGPGVKMSTIYQEAMIHDFKCRISTNANGLKVYVSPHGNPFPSDGQFRYQIKKAFGKETIQKTLYGKVRHRTRLSASKGRFSEEISNLMERVEADGYYTKERPKGYLDGTTLPAICVVTGRDVLSGLKVGIGFSFGAERNTAYRMMLFSMAVPKDFFCSLFGITLQSGEWPSGGVPAHFSIDRGPGARKDLIKNLQDRFPIRDMAPSWSGQSKATVESSHPRDIAIEGEPTFLQSLLTPVELAKREIFSLIQYNHTASMDDRIDPESDLAQVAPSPIGLWNYYDKIFRNDAQSIGIDNAVRTFLSDAEFSLKEDGIYLGARRYRSNELDEIGLFEKSGEFHHIGSTLKGYVLDMCVRHAWVEVKGRLYLLEAMLRIRGDEETLWMSLSELEQWAEARRKVNSAFRIHQDACASDLRQRFYEDAGHSSESAVRRTGKPRKTAQAIQEAKDVKQTNSSKKVA
jgi:hypothetical protein